MRLNLLCPRLVAFAIALATAGCELDWSVPAGVHRSRGGKAGEGGGGDGAGQGGAALGTGAGGDGAAPTTTTTSTASTTSTTTAPPDCDHGTCDACQTCAMEAGGPCEALVASCTGACDAVWACEDGADTSCPLEYTCGECFDDGVEPYCALLACVMFNVCATACTQEAQPTSWPYCSF